MRLLISAPFRRPGFRMYELRSTSADQWSVVDDDGEPVYVGSLRQCEDWLDRQENRLRSSRPGVLRRLWLRLRQLFFWRAPPVAENSR